MMFAGDGFTMGGGVLSSALEWDSCKPHTFFLVCQYEEYFEKKMNKAQKKELHDWLENRTKLGRNKVADAVWENQFVVLENELKVDQGKRLLDYVNLLFDDSLTSSRYEAKLDLARIILAIDEGKQNDYVTRVATQLKKDISAGLGDPATEWTPPSNQIISWKYNEHIARVAIGLHALKKGELMVSFEEFREKAVLANALDSGKLENYAVLKFFNQVAVPMPEVFQDLRLC